MPEIFYFFIALAFAVACIPVLIIFLIFINKEICYFTYRQHIIKVMCNHKNAELFVDGIKVDNVKREHHLNYNDLLLYNKDELEIRVTITMRRSAMRELQIFQRPQIVCQINGKNIEKYK